MTQGNLEPASDTFKGVKAALWALVVAVGLFVVAMLIGAFIVHKSDVDNRERDRRNLVTARVEACKTYNQDQTRNRLHDHQQLITVTEIFSPGRVDSLLNSPQLAQYDEFSAEFYPYRQCSIDCIVAQFDPTIDDCPPAQTEGG